MAGTGLADPLPSVVGPARARRAVVVPRLLVVRTVNPAGGATAAADGGGARGRPLSGARDLTRNLTAVDLAFTARRAASSGRRSGTCSDLPCQTHGGVVSALSDRGVFATSDKARLVGAAVASRRRQAAKLAPTLEGKRDGGWARHRAVVPWLRCGPSVGCRLRQLVGREGGCTPGRQSCADDHAVAYGNAAAVERRVPGMPRPVADVRRADASVHVPAESCPGAGALLALPDWRRSGWGQCWRQCCGRFRGRS